MTTIFKNKSMFEAAPGKSDDDEVPCMPCLPSGSKLGTTAHREMFTLFDGSVPCCIARKVGKSEYKNNPKATSAMDLEWEKLRTNKRPDPKDKGKGAWDETMVREAADVRAEARRDGATVHFARIAELCTEKGSELPDDHPDKKYKGRAVVLGDNVKDEGFNWAEFQELSSAPASLEAAKALDAFGCVHGYKVKAGDAIGAYCQAYLPWWLKRLLKEKGTATYVYLPENRWPAHCKGKCKNPVAPLVLALYGHPESGGTGKRIAPRS